MSNPVPRLRRLLSIIPLIQRRGGISLDELQTTLGVSKRELQGDLNAIMLCGVPPYLPNDYISVFIDGNHVTVDYADHFARPASLNLNEALALRLAIARLQVPEDGPLYEAYIEILEAVDHLVLGEDMASLEGRIEAPQAEDTGDKLGTLDAAIQDRVPVQFTYYSASSEEVTQRQVRPYGRGDKAGNEYIVAHCEKRDMVLSFRIDRISQIERVKGGGAFEIPEKFDLREFVSKIGLKPGEGSIHARIRFQKSIARQAAEDHAEMRVEQAPKGEVVLNMICGSDQYAVSKALHYGELAEILEPPSSREALVARLKDYLAAD